MLRPGGVKSRAESLVLEVSCWRHPQVAFYEPFFSFYESYLKTHRRPNITRALPNIGQLVIWPYLRGERGGAAQRASLRGQESGLTSVETCTPSNSIALTVHEEGNVWAQQAEEAQRASLCSRQQDAYASRAAHRARWVSTRLHIDITAAANGMWAGLMP